MSLVFLSIMGLWLIGPIHSTVFSGSSDEKFFKKYAMMKIYQSCYGKEVMKEIQKEMKTAYEKCTATAASVAAANSNIPMKLKIPFSSNSQLDFETMKIPTSILANNYLLKQNHQPNHPFNNYMPNNFIDLNNALYWHYLQMPQQNALQQYLANNLRFSKDLKFNNNKNYNGKAAFAKNYNRQQPNSSCIMYELGYINENSEIDLQKINWKIQNLTIPEHLKNNLLEGVEFCYQFSKCVPEFNLNNAPLSKDLSKPNFFLRCYKHKKVEACIMKDIRERFAKHSDGNDQEEEQAEEEEEENANGFDNFFRRNGRKVADIDDSEETFDNLLFPIDDSNDESDIFF